MSFKEQSPTEKNEFAEAYMKEFEEREKEKEQKSIEYVEPIEVEEEQTKLEDYTEGGKFGEKIERDKEIMKKERKEKKERIKKELEKELAVKLGIVIERFYTADKYPEEVRKNIEETSEIIVPEKRKEFIESALRVQPTPQKIKEMLLKEIEEIKKDFIRIGFSPEEVDEIHNTVKMKIESDYKQEE